MSSAKSQLWTRTVAAGVVAVAFVVGNASLSASGATQRYGKAAPAATPSQVDVEMPDAASALSNHPLSGFGYSRFDSPAADADRDAGAQTPSDAPDGSGLADTGQVVPAIYAWDPDVRFVFYRHVSKWM